VTIAPPRPLLVASVMLVAVIGGGIAVWLCRGNTETADGGSPADDSWPPMMEVSTGGTFPAIQATYYHCLDMNIKHEWLIFSDVSLGPDMETLVIDQRPLAWIEDYYGHPVDEGTRTSTYNQVWIEEYLGHPLPDGYFMWAAHTCALDFLGAPPGLVDLIIATTPEDGEMSATWSTFVVTWTNNGVDGPDAVIGYSRSEE
jgi:hypothetical protein